MRSIQFDTVHQSPQIEAVLIKTSYDAPYAEPDYTSVAALSFPIRSCFGYRNTAREWLADGNSVLLERPELEFSVRKFKPFSSDATLCVQLPDAPEIVEKWLPRDCPAALFRRGPLAELHLRRFLAGGDFLQREQGLFDLLDAVFASLPVLGFGAGPLNFYQNRQVERAKDFIHDQHREPLSIAQIAAAACISPFHFSRLFRRATGCAPYDYLLQIRVEDARRLLAAGRPVAEAAFSAGFNSVENFSLAFKKLTGLAPAHFQKSKIY